MLDARISSERGMKSGNEERGSRRKEGGREGRRRRRSLHSIIVTASTHFGLQASKLHQYRADDSVYAQMRYDAAGSGFYTRERALSGLDARDVQVNERVLRVV